MPTRDLYHTIKPVQALAPAVIKTTTNGADVDTSNFEAVDFVLNIGAWTDGTHTFKLQESDDNGSGSPASYGDVAAAGLLGSFTVLNGAGGQNTVQEVGYIGSKRWVRIVTTVTASPATGAAYGADCILGRARNLPA